MGGMSDRPPPEPDATQPIGDDATQRIPGPPPSPPPPPSATQPLRSGGPPQPPRRQYLAYALLLLLGLVAGFVLGQFTGGDELGTEDLVLFENASSTFPISGAQFTEPFDDPTDGTCDKEAFKRMLRGDPERFEAWLEVLGLNESEFDSFVDRLEPKVLDRPTPVTNHGCLPGRCPFSLHSVLDAGTLVLVDPENGDRPVAKCRCGNPLKDPECPPNCLDQPTPTPTATPSPTPERTSPPSTRTPELTPELTPEPTPSPERTVPPTSEPSPTVPIPQ